MVIVSGLEIPEITLAEICHKNQVREISLFGSGARGELRPDSDLDILVEFAPEATIGWDFFQLEAELSHLFQRKVDLGTKRSLKPSVRQEALRDVRILYAA